MKGGREIHLVERYDVGVRSHSIMGEDTFDSQSEIYLDNHRVCHEIIKHIGICFDIAANIWLYELV